MKKLLMVIAIAAIAQSSNAAEPLLLEPLNSTVLSTTPGVTANSPQVAVPNQSGVYEATFTPANKVITDPNMVPQNAAAEGLPVPQKREPRVKIQTKQRSQGNSYWNPGGKGTKSYF